MASDLKTISKPPAGRPPLPLSQTEAGALATAPLSTVTNSATDALYSDLYKLVHGEIDIVSVANAANTGAADDAHPEANTSANTAPDAINAAASVEEKLTAAALGTNQPDNSAASAPVNNAATNPNDALETRKQKMANLSFAQRRHELNHRLVSHAKSVAHVYSLTAASLPKSHSAILQQKALKSSSPLAIHSASGAAKIHDPPPRLGATVQVSSDALQFVKSGWIAQDEAQDALYFHHDGLWKARAHCHDVLGALCVLSTPAPNEQDGVMQVDGHPSPGGGRWPDFPSDVALAVDRYESSKEKAYSSSELRSRLASAVRRKLVLGEIGAFGTLASEEKKPGNSSTPPLVDSNPLPWRVVIGRGCGYVKLTFGEPRTMSTAEALRQQTLSKEDSDLNNLEQYPIEARLSVLSEESSAPWKLLSIHVTCSPKTGESDHQLVLNKKQMFDLHRIGERAMIVEEAVCRKANADKNGCSESKMETVDEKGTAAGSRIPRPLLRLFEVAHAFALSLQIEILSAQAESLRRGAWGGGVGGSSGGTTECIAVSPAYFFDDPKESTHSEEPLAVMAVHFWSCDDRYGSPSVGDLTKDKPQEDYRDDASSFTRDPNQRVDDNHLPKSDRRGEQRLSLVIRAVPTVGLVVSLSGGADLATERVDESVNSHMNRNLEKLLSSIQDPFQLSMSDALLAATVLCADRRCEAVVSALRRQSKLPSWIHLEVECGTIAIAATVTYPTSSNSEGSGKPTILFRMALDSRTGRFTPTFPRPASILRMLACNDPSASETQALHSAAALQSVTRSNDKRGDATLRDSSGRIVRDAFESLSRSMDTLGRKCGVLGKWNDLNAQSVTLREKSIGLSAQDARASLITCCGLSAVYGVGAIAMKIVAGVDCVADAAGGPIVDESIPNLLRCPPLSVPMHQQLVEKVTKEGDGEIKRTSQIQGELFALSAQASERDLSLICFDVLTLIETASSVPLRLNLARISPPHEVSRINLGTRPKKRVKTETCSHLLETVEDAAFWIDTLLRQ